MALLNLRIPHKILIGLVIWYSTILKRYKNDEGQLETA